MKKPGRAATNKGAQKPTPSIVLAMVVRNERHVIRRAIESALPIASSYLIVDTGSTDDTMAIAAEALAGKPGDILSRPWVNHGHNRSELLALARERGDWVLLLDADEVLELAGPVPELVGDGYELSVFEGAIASSRVTLVRASLPWFYVGELRELLVCEEKHSIAPCTWARVIHYEDGAQAQRDPYERRMQEAEVFRAALDLNPRDARAAFYWAESLRLAGDLQGALAAYEYRAALGGRDDETFWTLFQIASLHDRRARLANVFDPMRAAVIVGMYLRAYSFRPTRPEPLVELARHFGDRGEWATAQVFAEAACSLECIGTGEPPDRFSVDFSVLAWRAYDALALCCFSLEDYQRAEAIWSAILPRLPAEAKARVERNLGFARSKVGDNAKAHREPNQAAVPRPPAPTGGRRSQRQTVVEAA